MAKTDILKDIVAKKKERLILAKQVLPEEELKLKLQGLPETRNFLEAISKPRQLNLIAEIKKASPSRGLIRENFIPTEIAKIYQEAGASAVSVLTEEDYFQGSPNYINEVKNVCSLPILRKDFIFEAYQVYESRFYGADAILLIADLLAKDKIIELLELANSLGLGCLVESHNEKDLKKILTLKQPFAVGINNRDLHTLEVDLKTTEQLYMMIPKGRTVVVESGIKSRQDMLFLKVLGINAVLVGEAFMSAENIFAKVEEMLI